MKILNNPLLRLIGVFVVIYFGLFRNTHQTGSLGNRLDPEIVKKELSKAKDNSQFIIYNLGKAEELKGSNPELNNQQRKVDQPIAEIKNPNNQSDLKQNQQDQPQQKIAAPQITDLVVGVGEPIVCNDLVELNYQVKFTDQSWSEPSFIKVEIGDSKADPLIALNLFGMKKDGVRLITFPKNYSNNQQELVYKLTIVKITKLKHKKYSCEK